MKSQLGVTMIELVIVLIITLLIAAVAVSSGQKTLTEADITEVYVEMTSMQKTINSVMLQKEMNPNIEITKGKYYDEEFSIGKDTTVSYGKNVSGKEDDWRIIYGVAADKEVEKAIYDTSKVKDILGLDTINHTYIVNYETGEIELLRPLKIDDKLIRTYYEVRSVAE